MNRDRVVSGTVVNQKNEAVEGASAIVAFSSGERRAITDEEGNFRIVAPSESIVLKIEGKYIVSREVFIGETDGSEGLRVEVEFVIPPIHESVIIVAAPLAPGIARRNDAVYNSTLFSRDDQVFHTLDAGISAGQHEGGGKSLEIRRFGFNLDHGGVNGGLKILVDAVQQNQGTQGHGQGYLGQLKSLTPELIQEVDILNGPFSAEYGDFSGLGVIHIRLKESLADLLTARIQAGSYDSFRTFLAYSPRLQSANSFIAYEASRTNGPFLSPLEYKRDNLTGNYTRLMSEASALSFKINAGRNDFFSSGQIPLDEVAAGRLDPFGFLDPDNGGRAYTGLIGTYYRKEWDGGSILKVDGFLSRSLFDLYSNFTFFLNDRVNGDEIQQHDSRLQEGVNLQYLRPYRLLGRHALFTAGGNFHGNQINVGLYNAVGRNPFSAATKAHAGVMNAAGYAQQGMDFFGARLHMNLGLRYDYFRFDVEDMIEPTFSGDQGAARFQPKVGVAFTPTRRVPATFYFNFGRGISSQDARGVVRDPSGPKISTTDFYQVGASHNINRFSLSADLFLIDSSNAQVYIPDDGSIEFQGPSRAYGFEAKTSMRITTHLSFNGGVTRVGNAFFRGSFPRIYVDSAPHTVSNASLTLAKWRGFSGSLRFRYINSYRLDGENPHIRASGLTVTDFSMDKRIRNWLDFNLSVDNLADKRFFETQNFFESRIDPQAPAIARIHGTPGYPINVTVGLTFRLFGK